MQNVDNLVKKAVAKAMLGKLDKAKEIIRDAKELYLQECKKGNDKYDDNYIKKLDRILKF